MIPLIVPFHPLLKNELLQVWESSVLATHDFLLEDDFVSIKKSLTTFDFASIDTFCILKGNEMVGFLGIANQKIEMLFIKSGRMSEGYGTMLMQFAFRHFTIKYVDVNDQNVAAKLFYTKIGFEPFAHSPRDSMDMSYPILHFKRVHITLPILERECYFVRKMQTSDLDQLVTIWLEASLIAHDFVSPSFWKNQQQAMKEIYLPQAEVWVIENSTQIAGFAALMDNTIAALFVDPKLQGKGFGSQLMFYIQKIYNQLELQVFKKNKKSIDFYVNKGFAIEKTQKNIATEEAEYVMKWKRNSHF